MDRALRIKPGSPARVSRIPAASPRLLGEEPALGPAFHLRAFIGDRRFAHLGRLSDARIGG